MDSTIPDIPNAETWWLGSSCNVELVVGNIAALDTTGNGCILFNISYDN